MNTKDIREGERGFSLIESLIVVSIITIMSSLSLQALPIARSHQQLIADTEQIRALLLDAKERALNQVRPENCLPRGDSASPERAGCSDVGIAFVGNQIIEFADTENDNIFKGGKNGDYIITRRTTTSNIGSAGVRSLLFKSVPPSAVLYADGNPVAPNGTSTIILNGESDISRTLLVRSYGTIDIQ